MQVWRWGFPFFQIVFSTEDYWTVWKHLKNSMEGNWKSRQICDKLFILGKLGEHKNTSTDLDFEPASFCKSGNNSIYWRAWFGKYLPFHIAFPGQFQWPSLNISVRLSLRQLFVGLLHFPRFQQISRVVLSCQPREIDDRGGTLTVVSLGLFITWQLSCSAKFWVKSFS